MADKQDKQDKQDMRDKGDHLSTSGQWLLSAYRWKTEPFMDHYVQGFKEKKLLGLKCAGCGAVYLPPVPICARCHSAMRPEREEDWLPVSQEGTVITFTVSYTDVSPGGLRELSPEERRIFALVQPDSVDTHLLVELKECGEDEVHVGMRVQAAWVEEPQGVLADLSHYIPVKTEGVSPGHGT